MRIVLGLGNPGDEYARMRHNLGKRTLDALLGEEGWEGKPGLFLKVQEEGKAKKKIVFAKSLTFMNDSGKAAARLVSFYKISPERLLVIHDDADILFGRMKLSFGSRSAGHQGVESIIGALKTLDFWRLRIGIQPKLGGGRVRAEGLILKRFSREEERALPDIFKKAHHTLAAWLEQP